jgi:hypothetical protein
MMVILVVGMLMFTACNPELSETPTREEIVVEATPTIDFYYMRAYPRTEQAQPLNRVTKLVFTENAGEPDGICVAIDLGNRALYSHDEANLIGLEEPDISLTDADIAQLLDILAKYDVQSWETDYSSDEANFTDGFAWGLSFEYDDQTVENHHGLAPLKEECIPANYDAFLKELLAFREARIG